MKFYTTVSNVKKVENEKAKFYILFQPNERSGILCFLPRQNAPELEKALDNEEWKNGVVEIEFYSYKSKTGDYKDCFRIIDVLPCYPID